MRNNDELPKCPLRFGGKCQHNRHRCGKKERALLQGKYGREFWGWRKFPFFLPMDCWDKIRRPKFIIVRTKGGTREKHTVRPSKCPRCWALDKDTGQIYKFKEASI